MSYCKKQQSKYSDAQNNSIKFLSFWSLANTPPEYEMKIPVAQQFRL